MYLSHYNLKEKPFSISPDPKFIWLGEKHKEALAILKYGILESKGFLLLTGGVGTGKTFLINALIEMIDVAAIVAAIPDLGLNALDFFNILSEEFKMNRKFDSKGTFLIQLRRFLHEAYADDKRVLLVIDEAQRLDHDLLEQIRLLSNIEMDNRKLINIFFVGQSEFNQMLMKDRNRAVRQRITVNYHLEHLTARETEKYIHHRLDVAGAAREIFTVGAIRQIFSFSHGNPRLINIICDHALLSGYAGGLKLIGEDTIKECKEELQIKTGFKKPMPEAPQSEGDKENRILNRKFSMQPIGFFFILLLLLSIFGYLIYNFQYQDSPRWGIEDVAPKKAPIRLEEEIDALIAEISEIKPVKKVSISENYSREETQAKESKESVYDKNVTRRDSFLHTPNTMPFANQKTIIHFKHNSNELTDRAFENLNYIVRFFVQNPESEIIIEGYSDSFGNYWYNQKLSIFRADIIKNYFAGQGIPLSKIKVFGMGSKNPIASNADPEGRQQNRRVEIKIKH